MTYQYAASCTNLVRAQYHAGISIIWPVRISRPQSWMIPHPDGLLDTGVRCIADVPLGTWLDMFTLVRSGRHTKAEPLVRQVRSYTWHENRKYSIRKP